MKHVLNADDIDAAIWGGAILGGGGGGLIEPGLARARSAMAGENVQLWTLDEFAPDALTATVAIVGAPASAGTAVEPDHMLRSLDLLATALPAGSRLAAINTNENGAETTANGWLQSLATGLPVLDFACNGRAHPTGLMGAMGLHRMADYRSLQAFAGGAPDRYVEGVVAGRLERVASLALHASIEAGAMIAVARNPVTMDYARTHGAPGAISQAIRVGHAWLSHGLSGVLETLKARIAISGQITDYHCEHKGGLDVGHVRFDDAARTELRFVNEYMLLKQNGRAIVAFPNLIMTFDDKGAPVPSACLAEGMQVAVVVVEASNLILSSTMSMAELYTPVEHLLTERIWQKT